MKTSIEEVFFFPKNRGGFLSLHTRYRWDRNKWYPMHETTINRHEYMWILRIMTHEMRVNTY